MPVKQTDKLIKANRVRRAALLTSSSAVLLACMAASPAFAQAVAPPPAPATETAKNAQGQEAPVSVTDSDGNRLEDIVVTARKTEENLQRVPLAVTALSAAMIESRNLKDTTAIAGSTPSLVLQPAGRVGAAGQPAIFLRGIGSADNTLTVDPAVGVYVDGVYFARTLGSVLTLGDIQRIEVLRGPQGTLFGKNSIGGAISITSNPASDHFEAKAELTVGDYNRRGGKAMVNVPLTDNLFLRVAGYVDLQDGYIQLTNYPGKAWGDNNVYGGQIKLRWMPTDKLRFDLSYDHNTIDNTGIPTVLIKTYPNARTAQIFNQFYSGDPTCVTAAGQATNPKCFGPISVPTNIYRSNDREFDINGNPTDPFSYNNNWGINLISEYQASFGTLTSTTSYRNLYATSDVNGGFIDALYFEGIRDPDKSRQFSQELRLNGKAFNDRLSWLVGGFFFDEHYLSYNPALSPLARLLPGNPYPIFSLGLFTGHNQSIAAFAQATYSIVDSVRLTVGARYTNDVKTVQANIRPGTITDFAAREKVNRVDPSASLAIDITRNVNFYVSYSQGFRNGGFPTRVPGGLSVLPTFGPETAKAYEAGLKSQLFDNRMRANLAVFRTDYNAIQAAGTSFVFNPPQATTINAGNARIQGVEAELTAVPSRYFQLDASMSYLDPKFTKVDPTANDGGFPITTKTQFAYAPKWKLHGGATVTVPIGGGDLLLRADVDYSSKVWFNLANTLSQSPVTLVNASATYKLAGDHVGIVVGVKNLTNKIYYTFGLEDRLTNGTAYQTLAPPRMFYLTLRYKY
jgi:iron complex outermembrane receptor protein